jgi:hypothetical protein
VIKLKIILAEYQTKFLKGNVRDMEKIKHMIIKKLVGFEETEDMFLDYHFYNEDQMEEIFPESPHWVTLGVNERHSYPGANVPMPIDEAIEMLQKMKEKGANYIEIDYHCDHVSYLFSGWEIRKATKEELDKEQSTQDEYRQKIKEKKIKELQDQINELKNEVQ